MCTWKTIRKLVTTLVMFIEQPINIELLEEELRYLEESVKEEELEQGHKNKRRG